MANKSPERSPPDVEAALAFIKELFGNELTESNVYFSSLANNDAPADEPGERRLATRDPEKLANFIGTWDKPDRGLYFAVGTVSDRRTKDGIVETIGLHADIDFKGVVYSSYEDIFATIGHLLCRPTAVVRSGHGVHLYWLLHKAIPAQENRDRVEELLKLVANVVAGDTQVCEISRLMRLPGTHNTKFNSWVAVECVYADGPRYELQELEDWLGDWSSPRQRPVLHRRVGSVGHGSPDAPTISASPAAATTLSDNPFIRMAQEHGVKLPIDVDARLAAMTYHGDGDAGVHATQVQVSAALLERGAAVDEVVERILTATQAVAGTGNWDWRKERRDLHSMCLTWLSKRSKDQPALDQGPPDELAQEPTPNPGPDGFTKATKAPRMPPKPPPKPLPGRPKRKELHIPLALQVLDTIATRGERILVHATGAYWYLDNQWQLLDDRELKNRLHREIEIAAKADAIPTDRALRSETREWILARPEIYQPEVEFDAHGKVPVINGLIDPRSGKLEPPKQEHYVTWRIEQIYDAAATCPVFDDMLAHVFADREPETYAIIKQLLFELIGVGLIDKKGKALSRATLFEGGADTGKSQLLRVIGNLFGQTIGVTIASLEGTHGLMPFIRRKPYILDEAADEGEWHKSSIVKLLISGDPIAINMKHGQIITKPFTAPIFWGTNHLPQFKEITRAIAERMVLLQCRCTFDKNKPIGPALTAREHGYMDPADLVIDTEMAGVLAAAVAGLKHALNRGFFIIPEESIQLMAELHEVSNVAIPFRNDCLRYSPGKMISCADMYAMFSGHYAREYDIDHIPTQTRFGLAMKGLCDPRIVIDRKLRAPGSGKRYYGCVEPTVAGIECWKLALEAEHFNLGSKKFPGASAVDAGVPAVPLLHGWGDKVAVKRARKLWDEAQKAGVDPGSPTRLEEPKIDQSQRVTKSEKSDGVTHGVTRFDETGHDQKPLGHRRPRF